jgi:hypothetical protein
VIILGGGNHVKAQRKFVNSPQNPALGVVIAGSAVMASAAVAGECPADAART